jgi:putative protease
MFVHGALCVSYSGQCFSSEAWGGRSANRGQCAQACRLPYELFVDGRHTPLGDARYLLSPGDLYALHQIPEIVQLGVAALKIEGRYKDAEYVALTTRAYRAAVDAAWAGQPHQIERIAEIQLEQVYSRGLGPHFITGTNHQAVVRGRAPRHRGVLVGRVARVLADAILIVPEPAAALAPIKPGDGLVFDAADWRSPEEPEEGGRVFEIAARSSKLELRFGRDAIQFGRIRPGDLVWRTADPELDRVTRHFTAPATPLQRQPVRVRATAHAGMPLALEWQLVRQPHIRARIVSDQPLETADRHALDQALLREQLGRLGGTPYELAELELAISGQPFAPTSMLNQMRRAAVEGLARQQSRPPQISVRAPLDTLAALQAASVERQHAPAAQLPVETQLHLLVRTPQQLEAAIACRPASITLDYLELYGLRPAVERVRAAGIKPRVASPRVLKPSEQRIVRFLVKLDCAILVRSTGLLHALQSEAHPELIGDFSLNTANVLTADALLQLGLARITPTHDLNAAQVADLTRSLGAERVEVIGYQHLPVFHTEHCVFCRFLSEGTSYKDCGHPCERHQIALRDVHGRAHPVLADVGCRNTVFGAEAQEASAHLQLWRDAGTTHFRLEFVHETGEQARRITQAWQHALARRVSPAELGAQLRRCAPQSTTEGSLFVPEHALTIPLIQD